MLKSWDMGAVGGFCTGNSVVFQEDHLGGDGLGGCCKS